MVALGFQVVRVSVAESQSVRPAAIALGANLGDPGQTLDAAVEALAAIPSARLVSRSRWIETTAVGPTAPRFVNGAVLLETPLAPESLLAELHEIETRFGRARPSRWAPRTLDLDLIFLGQEIRATPTLRLPHPAAFYRRFVLDPLVEIAPDWLDPVRGLTARALHHRLTARPFRVAVLGDLAPRIVPQLVREFPAAVLTAYGSHAESPFASGASPRDEHGTAPLPELIVDLSGRPAPAPLAACWLDLWGHFTTPAGTARDESAALDRLREVLASALGA